MKRKIVYSIGLLLVLIGCTNNQDEIEGSYFLTPTSFNDDSLYLSDGQFEHVIRYKSGDSIVYRNTGKYSIERNSILLYDFFLNDNDREYPPLWDFESAKYSKAELTIDNSGDILSLTINSDAGIFYHKSK